MLFLLFQLGADRYGLETSQIAEVLPLVQLKQIPQAPVGVAGAFDYRGKVAPVVDLNHLILGGPARRRLSTRIILVNYPLPIGEKRFIGLVAERVSAVMRREASDFSSVGVTTEKAPYLGPVTKDDQGLVQWIEVETLLPESLQSVLFRDDLAPTP
jgi:chemotaxis-related protein WspB